MRIISGDAKGRTLYAPDGDQTRPTSDKIRGAVFNILSARVYGARVLDLFGGTGALALEALSRGAAYAVIADVSPQAIKAIDRNARGVLKESFDTRVRILKADYRTAIAALPQCEPFDLIFLDPPYRMIDAYGDALARLHALRLITPEARIVAEHIKDAAIDPGIPFEIYDTRRYGETEVSLIRLRETVPFDRND